MTGDADGIAGRVDDPRVGAYPHGLTDNEVEDRINQREKRNAVLAGFACFLLALAAIVGVSYAITTNSTNDDRVRLEEERTRRARIEACTTIEDRITRAVCINGGLALDASDIGEG